MNPNEELEPWIGREFEGTWKEAKGKVKEQWGKLTDDDLNVISGKRDQLEGKIQERYGVRKDLARQEIEDWLLATPPTGKPVPKTEPRAAGKSAPKALGGLESMRKALRKADPSFAAAEAAVREAVAFCASVRTELRQRRKDVGLDQSALGERLGLSQSAVSKIENGRGDIGLETIYEYADAVGLRPVVVFVPAAQTMADRASAASAQLSGAPAGEGHILPAKAVEAAQIAMIQAVTKSIPAILGKLVVGKSTG